MDITHIQHSTFLIETKDKILLFDYYDGSLPETNKDKKVYIFASHSHQDHFSMKVFDLFKNNVNVKYILSYDIRRSYRKTIESAYPEKAGDVTYMIADQKAELDDITVETLGSTDKGVSYIVTVEGRTLYHSGDLHLWIWQGESDKYNRDMEAHFIREMKKIQGRKFDIAFYPVDPRQNAVFDRGIRYFLDNTETSKVFPMHFLEDYSVIGKLMEKDDMKEYKERIICMEHDGEKFYGL
jgi:L-ascorbate metabolism protein UlaG (beta-lactamase superfamily)